MERLFTFWRKYTPIPPTVKTYVEQHAQVKEYPARSYFMRPGERKPYWCLVLEGMAYGYSFDEAGRQHVYWFALPYQGFIGTRHLYTEAAQPLYIRFIQPTQLLLLSAFKAREGKEHFKELSELMHVLKQQFIKRNNKLIRILQEPDLDKRYASFVSEFPKIERATTAAQQMAFINMANGSFYRAKNHYLHHKS